MLRISCFLHWTQLSNGKQNIAKFDLEFCLKLKRFCSTPSLNTERGVARWSCLPIESNGQREAPQSFPKPIRKARLSPNCAHLQGTVFCAHLSLPYSLPRPEDTWGPSWHLAVDHQKSHNLQSCDITPAIGMTTSYRCQAPGMGTRKTSPACLAPSAHFLPGSDIAEALC